jgi:hypothetical protein
MTLRWCWVIVVLLANVPLFVSARDAPAAPTTDFRVVSESAIYKPSSGEVTFKIVFNQTPDFFTTDSAGRQANSFQYFIVGDQSLSYPSNYDSIIRGEEIHTSINLIPIRNAVPPDYSDPRSGGWGTIRGEVPYTIRGRVLTFTVPLSLITDQGDVSAIDYRLETYQFGELTGVVESDIQLNGIGSPH